MSDFILPLLKILGTPSGGTQSQPFNPAAGFGTNAIGNPLLNPQQPAQPQGGAPAVAQPPQSGWGMMGNLLAPKATAAYNPNNSALQNIGAIIAPNSMAAKGGASGGGS